VREPAHGLGPSEERFRTLLDHLPHAVVLFADPSLRVLHISRPGAPLGWEPEEMVGRRLPDLLADRPQALAQYEAGVAGHATSTMYRSLNGARDYEFDVVPLMRDGAVLGVMSVAQDVTERAAAERAVREAKDEFESAFANAPIGMALVAPDGRWLRVNRSLCELTGYAEHELLGMTFQEITHPDDLDVDVAYVRQMLEGDIDSYSMEKRYVAKDGAVVPALLSVTLVRGSDGLPRHFISQIQDRRGEVRRLQLERELADARRAESLGVLAGGVAHDFNNLLQAIGGHTALALAELPVGSPVGRRLETVQEAAALAGELAAKMLQYSGRRGLELVEIDLSELVRAAAEGLRVELRLAAGLPRVRGDAGQIALVPRYLLENALEAGGSVVASTGVRGRFAYLEIADDGEGMDDETRDRMFEPFFSTRFTGRGLGLAAVEGIVRSHGGDVEVESARGVGTTVRVLLPAA
jgi:PAS domain S-box-containing protein